MHIDDEKILNRIQELNRLIGELESDRSLLKERLIKESQPAKSNIHPILKKLLHIGGSSPNLENVSFWSAIDPNDNIMYNELYALAQEFPDA